MILTEQRLAELQKCMMLLYTETQRFSHQVLEKQMENSRNGSIDKKLSRRSKLVSDSLDILTGNFSLEKFDEVLHQGWSLKKQFSADN